MSLVIGIIGRPKVSEKHFFTFSKSITDVITKYGCVSLGIIPAVTDVNRIMPKDEVERLCQLIDLCDGIILQGGTDYYQYDIEAIKYIYNKNIPLLGVCLGMQSMAAAFGATLNDVDNHNCIESNYAHIVKISEHSKLYEIVGKNTILVNSRHNEMVINPLDVEVVAYADNVIEAIEKRASTFFLGIQWHPEDMIDYDENSKKIFDKFFWCVKNYK